MHIREYQQWLEAWDRTRTWDQVTLGHTLLHAIEELGEVSKLVQMLEGYRPPNPDRPHQRGSADLWHLSDLD